MRTAQRLLASEVTELVHGGASGIAVIARLPNLLPRTTFLEQAVARAEAASRALFDRDLSAVKTADVLWALKGDPRLQQCSLPELLDTPITKLATEYQLTASNCKSTPNPVFRDPCIRHCG